MDCALSVLLEEKSATIFSVQSSAMVVDAVTQMNDRHVGSVLVIDDSKLVGIFTERDVLTKVVGESRAAKTTVISDVMTKKVVTVAPTMKVSEAMVLVTDRHFRHLPVVDGEKICGLISSGDLMRWMAKNQERTIHDLESYINGDYMGMQTDNNKG